MKRSSLKQIAGSIFFSFRSSTRRVMFSFATFIWVSLIFFRYHQVSSCSWRKSLSIFSFYYKSVKKPHSSVTHPVGLSSNPRTSRQIGPIELIVSKLGQWSLSRTSSLEEPLSYWLTLSKGFLRYSSCVLIGWTSLSSARCHLDSSSSSQCRSVLFSFSSYSRSVCLDSQAGAVEVYLKKAQGSRSFLHSNLFQQFTSRGQRSPLKATTSLNTDPPVKFRASFNHYMVKRIRRKSEQMPVN